MTTQVTAVAQQAEGGVPTMVQSDCVQVEIARVPTQIGSTKVM